MLLAKRALGNGFTTRKCLEPTWLDDDDNDDYDGNNDELDVADDASSSRTAY